MGLKRLFCRGLSFKNKAHLLWRVAVCLYEEQEVQPLAIRGTVLQVLGAQRQIM